MAEALGVVVSAAQAAEYCLRLCDLFDRLYHATATLREYQERILELTPLLRRIREEPSLDTPEITSCTQSIATILGPLTFLDKRRRPRFLDSITFVLKQKHFSRVFDSIGEKKSTLALYISTIILSEVRIGLTSRQPETMAIDHYQEEGREPMPRDRDEDGSGRREGSESRGQSDATLPINGERVQSMESITTMSDQGCRSGAVLHLPRQNLSHSGDRYFLPIQNRNPCQPIVNAGAASSAYQNNIMTGQGHMHNGPKVISRLSDERMCEISRGVTFCGNVKKKATGPVGKLETMRNGLTWHNGGYPARHLYQFSDNVMEGDGEMHNGDVI